MFSNEKRVIMGFVKESLEGLPLSEDLGDYIPFLAHYKELGFCDSQIELALKKTQWGMFYGDAFPKIRWAGNSVIVPEMNTDALLGLLHYHRQTKKQRPLELAKELADGLLAHCYSKGFVSALVSRLGPKAPFSRGMNGLYMELLPELHDLTGDTKYLEAAKEMASAWLSIPFFKEHKLFPTAYFYSSQSLNSMWKDCKLVTVFKHSTSIANGLLEIYRVSGDRAILDAMKSWALETKKRMTVGCVHGKLDIESQEIAEPKLLYNFPTIDFLCDLYAETKWGEALDFAEDLAGFWLKLQSEAGLFPLRPGRRGTLIDSVTDFSMSLFRLHELTRKAKYKQAAVKAVKANMRMHAVDVNQGFEFIGGRPLETKAFVDSVDYETGVPMRKWVKPKFIALLLKPIIYLESGKQMYKDKQLRLLLRDR